MAGGWIVPGRRITSVELHFEHCKFFITSRSFQGSLECRRFAGASAPCNLNQKCSQKLTRSDHSGVFTRIKYSCKSYLLCSRYADCLASLRIIKRIYNPLNRVKAAPAIVMIVGTSCQSTYPQNTLISKDTYSKGAATEASARL